METYRISNNGVTNPHRINTSLLWFESQDLSKYRAFYWDRDNSTHFVPLPVPSDYTLSASTCGNYGGSFAGYSDGNGHQSTYPGYWASSSSFQQYFSSSYTTGACEDINASGLAVGWLIATNSGSPVPFATSDGSNATFLTVPTEYSAGGKALGINSDGYIGGQLFGGSGQNPDPPVIWKPNQQQGYDIVDVSASSDWPSGRAGYIMGITDVNSSDNNGPYAVGYMMEGSDPACPFIYSMGTQRIRLLSTNLGIPTQVSNQSYDTSDAVVSFTGNGMGGTALPYVWVGSPAWDAQNNGCAIDAWAFFDPDVSRHSSTIQPVVTGIDRDFDFGGYNFNTESRDIWMSLASDWGLLSTNPDIYRTAGNVVGGQFTYDAKYADGRYVTLQRVPNATQGPPIVVVCDEQMDGALLEHNDLQVSVRGTCRYENAGSYSASLYLYNWGSGTWDAVGSAQALNGYMWTSCGKVSGHDNVLPYVDTDNGNMVRARLAVSQTGPVSVVTWRVSVESLRILAKP